MTPPEQQAFLSGVARKIQEIGKTQAGDNPVEGMLNTAKNIINNPMVRERLSMILPQDKVDAFVNQMAIEGKIQQVSNNILGNSATARRTATQQDFANKTASAVEKAKPIAKYLSQFDFVQPGSWIGLNPRNVEQLGSNMSTSNGQQVGEQIMKMLVNPDKNESVGVLTKIGNDSSKQALANESLKKYLQAGNGMAQIGATRALMPFMLAPPGGNNVK
jgi:hypothetical protein